MLSIRLPLALDSGLLALPETGRIAVIGPVAGTDLSALPRDRVHVVQGFRPDHDAFAARGYEVSTEPAGPYAAAIVCLPRARGAAQARIAEAIGHLSPGAPLAIDGQKTDGVDSMLRTIRARVPVGEALSKAHGKIFTLQVPDGPVFQDWAAKPLHLPEGFQTLPGVFSADGIDPASALLAGALPGRLGARVADLGAGWGFLSRAILERPDVTELHLVEADHLALGCARVNIRDPRAQFHWADALNIVLPSRMDAVVMNPPFHTGRAADPGLGTGFISAAAGMLAPHGTLWLVANRHLPYEDTLKHRFREVEEIAGSPGFKIYRAAKPAQAQTPARPGKRRV